MNKNIILDIQLACANIQGIPEINKIQSWVQKIFSFHLIETKELTIRIVDTQEMIRLNWYYSGRNYPTNVLSFPFVPPPHVSSILLGDIVICKEIIRYEAQQNNILPDDIHWAHIIIHGALHLLGYDHIIEKDAIIMHQMELKMIRKFGYQTCCFLK